MGWMQGLGDGVLRLLAARLLPASARIVEQVALLARERRNVEALELSEEDAGLTPEVYVVFERLAARLVEHPREEDLDWAALRADFGRSAGNGEPPRARAACEFFGWVERLRR